MASKYQTLIIILLLALFFVTFQNHSDPKPVVIEKVVTVRVPTDQEERRSSFHKEDSKLSDFGRREDHDDKAEEEAEELGEMEVIEGKEDEREEEREQEEIGEILEEIEKTEEEPERSNKEENPEDLEESGSSDRIYGMPIERESIPCGEVCQFSFPEKEGLIFPVIWKNINCKNIFLRGVHDKPAEDWPPPREPPAELMDAFTQNGELPIQKYAYYKQRYSGARTLHWTKKMIEEFIQRSRNGEVMGPYHGDGAKILEGIKNFPVKGKRGAVIGSETPWIESHCLSNGAREVVTIEYSDIVSTHPRLKAYTPIKAFEMAMREELEPFDFVFSFSSLEHSGLGRYGDSLNPYGDLEAAAQIWCYLKPGGLFYLGVPVDHNDSYIHFNAHRKYGANRLKHMGASFEQLAHFGHWKNQDLFVLRKLSEPL